MKDLLKIMLNGTYNNFKRIFFASDRVTDMELRNDILTGNVKSEKKVDEEACIGCGGCANVCPTKAITMKSLQTPVKIKEGWVKTEVPELNSEKCVFCYWCHDFCPIYSFYEQTGTIHPNNVGKITIDTGELLTEPIKISQDKLSFISQYLSDKSLLSSTVFSNLENLDEFKKKGIGSNERLKSINPSDKHDNLINNSEFKNSFNKEEGE